MHLRTLGHHRGNIRRLARGTRLVCRPYVARWCDDFEDPTPAVRRSAWALAQQPIPDFVLWVPGHDGTPGPGHYLAQALADLWRVPAIDLLERTEELPSAHNAVQRPTVDEVQQSLRVTKHVSGHGVLIDNVIASGASSAGAIRLLTEANIAIAAVGCVSVDLDAGSSRFIQRRGKTWDFNPFSAECPRGDLRHG